MRFKCVLCVFMIVNLIYSQNWQVVRDTIKIDIAIVENCGGAVTARNSGSDIFEYKGQIYYLYEGLCKASNGYPTMRTLL